MMGKWLHLRYRPIAIDIKHFIALSLDWGGAGGGKKEKTHKKHNIIENSTKYSKRA